MAVMKMKNKLVNIFGGVVIRHAVVLFCDFKFFIIIIITIIIILLY